jgi:hypothetical protein
MINIVTWKWEPTAKDGLHPKKRIRFTAEHVNIMHSMLTRNLRKPFRMHCITDNAEGIIPKVNCVPLWDDHRDLGGCYVRLKSFSNWFSSIVGPDFFSIDLDTVILQDITRLLERTRDRHEFRIWADTNPTTPYNGSFYYLRTGMRAKVWDTFDPVDSPKRARMLGYVGTDQAHISAALGRNEAKWTRNDGVYSYRCHFQERKRTELNGDEQIVFFHGSHDPSKSETQAIVPWVKDHWR